MDFMIKFCKIMKNISKELINIKNKKMISLTIEEWNS